MVVARGLLHLVPTAVSLAIIGGLTRFERGQSTHAQRVWTMTWLAVGGYVGALDLWDALIFDKWDERVVVWVKQVIFEPRAFPPWHSFLVFLLAAPAIGGFVVVGQVLRDFGVCTRIS